MGIQNYLKRVSTATKNIKSAIEEKGVPVSQCDGLEVLADKVRQIQTGSSQMFMMLAFKQSDSAPAVPTGGYFSDENITYPTGWSDGAGLTENIWMSYAIINSDGSFYKDWVTPIKISNEGKEIDLTDYALKSWVSAEIAKIQTGGTVDLSNYYTKSEIDSKIPGSVVSSINGLNGDVVLQGSSTVTITSSDNKLIFTANGGGSEPSESYISCRLYTVSNSKETAPEIPESNVSWDLETKTLINLPTGWRKKVIATAATPYVWEIVGNFSTSTGLQIGDWDGPNCLSGNDGDPGTTGPKGEDGDSWEEVYAVYNSVAVMPTINTSATDANGKTSTDDGYLPNFMFGTTAVAASIDLLSVDSTNRYLFKSRRRKHNGIWLSYSDPVIAGNWTETELSPEEIEKLKENIKTDVKDSLTEANQRVEALQTRLDSIDYTDATFIKDPDNALIAAITQYKDANQKSFADLIIDGKETEIKALAGAEVNEHLTEAGITIDGLGAKLKSFADFKDTATGDISVVSQKLDAVEASITTGAVHEQLENVNAAISKIDGKNAEIIDSVSKSTYIWVKKDSEGNIIADSTIAYDASQYLAKDAAYADKDKYEVAMKAQGYELELSVHAFSQIKQTAGEVDITAGDGKAAQLKIYGDNDTSRIIMKAEQVDFSGNMNGKGMVVTDLTVTGTKGEIDPVTKLPQLGATINSAYINECQINSCEIASQIKSKTYVPHDDTKNQEGKGFLIDAGAVEADGLEFAFYGQTADGNKFELTNNSLVIPSAVIGDVTVDTIQSKNYTEDESGNPNIILTEDESVGFKLSSSTNKFYVKGENYELNNGIISLENTDSLILGDRSFTEWLKNAGTWDEFITEIKGNLNVEGSITAQALYAKTSDYIIKIGDTVDQGTTERFTYSGTTYSNVWREHSTKTWTSDDVSILKQTISVKTGTRLIIPPIVVGWRIHAVTTGTISTIPSARLLVKNSGGIAVIDTDFIAGKDSDGRTSLSGSASGTNYYGNVVISGQTADITPGTYSVEIQVREEHLGANMMYTSSFKLYITDTIITAVKQGEADNGVSIGGNGILIKAGEQDASGDIKEASLISQNGKIVSTGFVLSDEITRIKTVASKDKAAAENDPNTIYIVLNI